MVDNYGDIGVCWRLARRLAHDAGWQVRLWVDDLASLARLVPGSDPLAPALEGIELVHWTSVPPAVAPHDVVIEAFACDPPPAYRAALTQRQLWLNLEYLSAESWAESCHGLPSPQPGGLTKTFFFPGFTAATGGLLREPGLLDARDAFQADAQARAAFLTRIGLAPELARAIAQGDADFYPVFCYPQAPVAAWRQAVLSQGRPAVIALAGGSAPALAGDPASARVRTVRLPFLAHDDFDRLLWCGTVNLVRGEDSFVRAQWAARPLLWHIYPQDDDAHLVKLDAWLDRLAPPAPVRALHHAWNASDERAVDAAWRQATSIAGPDWVSHARQWSAHLQKDVPELAAALVEFTRLRLEC